MKETQNHPGAEDPAAMPQEVSPLQEDPSQQSILSRRMDRRGFLRGLGTAVAGLGAIALGSMPDGAQAASNNEPSQAATATHPMLDIPQAQTVFAEAQAAPETAPAPLEFVLANVRVDTAIRARERIPVVLDENLTNPQGELQAQFSITKTPSPQGNIWRLYESWMDRGQQTEHNPVANEPLPLRAVREFTVCESGNVVIGGVSNTGIGLQFDSGFGRNASWQSIPIESDDPRGEGQIPSVQKVIPEDPNFPTSKDIIAFSVEPGTGLSEVQLVAISKDRKEAGKPLRTGIKHERILRILEARSTPDGQTVKMVLSTSGGLIEAEYNQQTGAKEQIVDGPGHHMGLKRYKNVVAEGYTVIDELGGTVVDKNTRTGQVQKIGFKHLADQANLQKVLPGTFSAKAAYVTETDKGSLKLLLPGSRAVSNEPLGVKTVAKLDLYIPGQTPSQASDAQDLDYEVKGTVGSAQEVMMGGNKVIKLLQLGTGSSTYSDEGKRVVNTDKGLEKTQRTTQSTPSPEPTPVPTPSPTPTRTGEITYTQRAVLPMIARNGIPSQTQSTRK